MSPAELRVLQAALRTRIVEPGALADALGLSVAEVRDALDRLTADGFVVRDADGRPALPPPQLPLIDAALARVHAQLEALAAVRLHLTTMPARLRHWEGAQNADDEVRMELRHGPDAVVDVWLRLCERGGAVDAFGCFPDPAPLARVVAQAGARSSESSRIRVIVGRGETDAGARDALAELEGRGVEVRALERPPGWFAGEGADRSAFPTAWGVRWPSTVRLVPHAVASQSLRSFFDELWRRAVPLEEAEVGLTEADWAPVLRLLERGLSDAEVARELGLSERTVRRRVEEAMVELGAADRFALGRAWAAVR